MKYVMICENLNRYALFFFYVMNPMANGPMQVKEHK